jgi:hypothetical protein
MVTAPGADLVIRYEGPGVEAEDIWGMTQANFTVARRGYPAKETAVMLAESAARQLAAKLGVPDTPEFRESAARHLGEAWIRRNFADRGHIDAILTVSRGTLTEHPELAEELKRATSR